MQFKKYQPILIVLIFGGVSALSGQDEQTKITIYEKQGKPKKLQPKWEATGKVDTFRISHIEISTKNGDTTKLQVYESFFLHRVDAITQDSVFQTLFLGKEMYQNHFNTKDCKAVSLAEPFIEIKYKTPKNGLAEDCLLLNCPSLTDKVVPDLKKATDCMEQKYLSNWLSTFYKSMFEDIGKCERLSKFFSHDVERLHQFNGHLLPKKGVLKYREEAVGDEKIPKIYYQISVENLPNGNRKYDLREDTTQAPPIYVRMMQSMDVMGKMSRAFGSKKPKPVVEEESFTIFELDARNQLAALFRHRKAHSKNEKNDRFEFLETRIERLKN